MMTQKIEVKVNGERKHITIDEVTEITGIVQPIDLMKAAFTATFPESAEQLRGLNWFVYGTRLYSHFTLWNNAHEFTMVLTGINPLKVETV